MNGIKRHRTLALLALVAFLGSLAVGVVYNTTASADPGPDAEACESGTCNCKLYCPPLHQDLCYGYKADKLEPCLAVCIPDPSQLCDIP